MDVETAKESKNSEALESAHAKAEANANSAPQCIHTWCPGFCFKLKPPYCEGQTDAAKEHQGLGWNAHKTNISAGCQILLNQTKMDVYEQAALGKLTSEMKNALNDRHLRRLLREFLEGLLKVITTPRR